MKLTSSWVKDLLGRTISDDKIVEALEKAGLEVEQVSSSKDFDELLVSVLVKKVIQHPGADRLHLVDVWDGSQEFRVVCGAPNVRPDMMAVLARVGAVLPGGERIAKAKLRGEVSEGMLCSERELGLGQDHTGILELPEGVKPGVAMRELFPADTVIDLKTPANRFDVLSEIGLAREVAAMCDMELPQLPVTLKAQGKGPAVTAGDARRFMLVRLAVKAGGETPRAMAARLRLAGMRSLSPVVDVTNYVMLEIGQPMHAYDAAKVKLPLVVRQAEAGEKLVTLDGVERKLTPEDVVIADLTGPIGLAGVMGGAATEVGPQTTEILLEAAVFDGVAVRKMAKRHGLRTEASARFERQLPTELPAVAMSRAVTLLEQVAEARLEAVTDVAGAAQKPVSVSLSVAWLSRFLGVEVTRTEVVAALKRLGLEAAGKADEVTVPVVPWWRPDIRLPEDLAEEVVRVIGYDRVPATIPSWRPVAMRFDRVRAKRRLVREVLYAAGLFEVMTYSFVAQEQLEGLGLVPAKHLKLKNPLSSEQAYLRSSLMPSHLAVLGRNRLYAKTVGFYEISNVFVKRAKAEQPDEPLRLAVTVMRPEGSYRWAKGILDGLARELNVELVVRPAEGDGLAPGRAGVVELGGRPIGRIGQVHPEQTLALKLDGEAAYLEVDLMPILLASTTRQFSAVERLPTMVRDVAVVVPQAVTWQEVVDVLAPERVAFVGDYYGPGLPEGHKGLTLRLTVSNPDRTPTEAEAAELEARVVGVLGRRLGAKPRN